MLKGAHLKRTVASNGSAKPVHSSVQSQLAGFASGGISVSSPGRTGEKSVRPHQNTGRGLPANSDCRSLRTLQLRAPAQIRRFDPLSCFRDIWWTPSNQGLISRDGLCRSRSHRIRSTDHRIVRRHRNIDLWSDPAKMRVRSRSYPV